MSPDPPVPAPRPHLPARSRVRAETTRAADGEQLVDRADAEWLYAWSLEDVCPVGDSLARRVIALG